MYADKSIYFSKKQKKQVDEMMIETFYKVKNHLSKYGCCTNLYLSGSLARKEPCIRSSSNGINLTSDIDYVIINKKKEDNKRFAYITKKVNSICHEFQNSFVVIDEDKLQEIQSYFARDLSLSFDKPLFQSFDLADMPSYQVYSSNCIESITTQLACYMLHPDFTCDKSGALFFRKSEYHWIKAILESVRLPFCGRGIIAYNDVIHLNYINEIRGAISEEDLLKIIKSRELTEGVTLEKRLIYNFVHDLLVYSFGESSEVKLLNLMISKVVDQYTCFQYATLSLFLYWYEKNNIWIRAFGDFIEGIQFAPKTSIECIKDNVRKFINITDGTALEEILVAFRQVRNIYVELLHQKNTRENIFSDIQ